MNFSGRVALVTGAEEEGKNRKGYDIGYALAANSCEGVSDVESCTVIAPDATTAFAVPNPNSDLAAPSVFSGLVARPVAWSD
jgi:hypothetical protein